MVEDQIETEPFVIALKYENDYLHNVGSLLTVSIPFPQGLIQNTKNLVLLAEDQPIECAAQVTANWFDGSIKWLKLDFIKTIKICHYFIKFVSDDLPPLLNKNNIHYNDEDKFLLVETNTIKFSLNKETSNFLLESVDSGILITEGKLEVTAKNGKEVNFDSHHIDVNPIYCLQGQSIQKLSISLRSESRELISLLHFTIYQRSPLLKIEHTIHNPQSAIHANGHWDLGDPNSYYLNNISLSLESPIIRNLTTKLTEKEDWKKLNSSNFKIFQPSSGGENWNSSNHVNEQNEFTLNHKEGCLFIDGSIENKITRLTPILQIDNKLNITIEQFWQNFPTAISKNNNVIELELFPTQKETSYELQPGEKKSHTIWLGVNNQLDWVHSNNRLMADSNWLNSCLLGDLYLPARTASKFLDLVNNSINGPNNFYAKREVIDEYGWRNFGDLYADHETASYTGNELFVSHYNNQYDPILGFLKQYIKSGDYRWFELANDLAKHVKDIDIYHTTEDKAEYNGGLFWHTDHYLQAFTSSHRSYSKHQESNAYQDHAGGGGPGGQHCYTSGLKLHYQLTGNEDSKNAVITLTSWISCVYEGTGTCVELLLALKNRNLVGSKNHFTGQYPLDRGTANYVNALLDSYELTLETHYLTQAEHIIKNTVHPNEDINQRQLTDVENTWFYTVFLQAICRYLLLKQTMKDLNLNFYYARDSLLNFAKWMSKHEYMYLEKPEILEYPNDTWTAQDLRKATIFAAAYYFNSHQDPLYLEKAEYFEKQVANKLNSSASKTYTRIMVLVLQNCDLVDFYKNLPRNEIFDDYHDNWSEPDYLNKGLLSGFTKVMFKRLLSLKLTNEINWIKKRLR